MFTSNMRRSRFRIAVYLVWSVDALASSDTGSYQAIITKFSCIGSGRSVSGGFQVQTVLILIRLIQRAVKSRSTPLSYSNILRCLLIISAALSNILDKLYFSTQLNVRICKQCRPKWDVTNKSFSVTQILWW